MRYFVLFGDSLREALDRKSFYVLMAVSALFIALCASVSFRPLDEREAIQSIVGGFRHVGQLSLSGGWQRSYKSQFEVSDVRVERDGDDTRHRFRLTATPADETHRLIRHWSAIDKAKVKSESDPVPDAEAPTDFELQRRFLRSRFREALIMNVELAPAGEAAWDASIRVAGRRALSGAEEMSLFFGAVRWRPRGSTSNLLAEHYMSSAEIVATIEAHMADTLAGWVGMVVAIVVTAAFVPNMLQKGTVDVLLSKPIHRTTLLLYKYLGGCTYVFLNAAFLVGGCWLALSVRTGHWNLYFPLTILNLTFFFAVLYSVSVLMGVMTRSFGVSCLVTLVVWAICWAVGTAYMLLFMAGPSVPAGLVTAVRFLYLLLPKTSDLSRLNAEICAKGTLGEASSASMPSFLPPLQTELVLLTSAAFAVLMIALACVRFSKRDY